MSSTASPHEHRPVPSPVRRQRWLLLFNCQAAGLADGLALLSDDVELEAHDTLAPTAVVESLAARVEDYDREIVAPGIERVFGIDLGERASVWRIPSITFHAFHPDFGILAQDGPLATGPLGLYHSAIVHAAYRAGFDVDGTVGLFGADTFRALGYFDRWNRERDGLLKRFGACGLDLAGPFLRWTRQAPFLYAPNRPKVACLKDVARALLQRAGLPTRETGLLPADGFADGPVCPVYPELAAALGVRGSYWFKREHRSELIGLRRFVEECFEVYSGGGDLTPRAANFKPQFDAALAWARTRR